MLDLVRAGLPAALEAGTAALDGPAVPLDEVRLLPPLAAPTVRDFVAFEEHVEGVVASVGRRRAASRRSGTRHRRSTSPTRTRWSARTTTSRSRRARSGSTSSSRSPSSSARDGASLTPEQAREHVFGYTVLNDWSARDLQPGR